jgi:hypothetical protein
MVLWCDANAGRLAKRGIWFVCVTEMPNELNHGFGLRYLKRGSWTSRGEYIAQAMAS